MGRVSKNKIKIKSGGALRTLRRHAAACACIEAEVGHDQLLAIDLNFPDGEEIDLATAKKRFSAFQDKVLSRRFPSRVRVLEKGKQSGRWGYHVLVGVPVTLVDMVPVRRQWGTSHTPASMQRLNRELRAYALRYGFGAVNVEPVWSMPNWRDYVAKHFTADYHKAHGSRAFATSIKAATLDEYARQHGIRPAVPKHDKPKKRSRRRFPVSEKGTADAKAIIVPARRARGRRTAADIKAMAEKRSARKPAESRDSVRAKIGRMRARIDGDPARSADDRLKDAGSDPATALEIQDAAVETETLSSAEFLRRTRYRRR